VQYIYENSELAELDEDHSELITENIKSSDLALMPEEWRSPQTIICDRVFSSYFLSIQRDYQLWVFLLIGGR
jgi:hypothetical protein